MRQKLIENCLIAILAFIVMGFFAILLYNIKPLNPLTETISKFSFTDIYYGIIRQTSKPQVSKLISIVDINQFTGRGNFAELLSNIESMNPKVICVDAVFEGNHLDEPEGDMALADVAGKYKNIVFSMKMEDLYEENGEWVSTFPIRSYFANFVPVKEAYCNVPRGNLYDDMKRIIPIYNARADFRIYRSMIVETANMFAGKNVTKESKKEVAINYSPLEFAKIKPNDVLKHPELFDGRIVFLGDLHEANDQHWSPIGTKLPGVEILAYGVQTLLDKKEVKQPHHFVSHLLSFFVVLCVCVLYQFFTSRTRNSDNLLRKFLLGSTYMWNVILFMVSSILLFVSFIIFSNWNISLSWGWAFSCIAFVSTAENLYSSVYKYVTSKSKHKNNNLSIER